jgi:hypothetical protein
MVNIPIHITAKAIRYSLKLSTLAEYNASITLTMAGKHKPIVPLLGSNLYPSLWSHSLVVKADNMGGGQWDAEWQLAKRPFGTQVKPLQDWFTKKEYE